MKLMLAEHELELLIFPPLPDAGITGAYYHT